MQVKIFKFMLSDCGTNFKTKNNKPLKAVSEKEIEKTINNFCKNIKSINVNTYTSFRHNNADTDEIWAIYTVICD